MPKALLFDLDGTLVDSLPDLTGALNKMLRLRGQPPLATADCRLMIGDGLTTLVTRALAARQLLFEQRALADFEAAYAQRVSRKTRPYAGVVETLTALTARGHHMAIVTNKSLAMTERLLADLDLAPFFRVLCGGDSHALRKPNALPLLATLQQLGVGPKDAVMIGDSAADMGAAKAAGVPSVLVTYGYRRHSLAELAPDHVAERFPQLLEIIPH